MAANGSRADDADDKRPVLTERERQVLSMLAEGQSGAQIAAELVLSPETVRTHVRNAMSKLGATTRSHAVALALQRGEIGTDTVAAPAERRSPPSDLSAKTSAALQRMLGGLVTLYDVDGGGVYLFEEDGLSVRRVAVRETHGLELPELVALGDGTAGQSGAGATVPVLPGRCWLLAQHVDRGADDGRRPAARGNRARRAGQPADRSE